MAEYKMTDFDFNRYLNEFDDYYFVDIDDDACRIINGKYGKIAPYSPERKLLGVWCINISMRRRNLLLQKMKNVLIKIHQDGEPEFGAHFHEKDLDVICDAIKARKRRQLSEEKKQVLRDRLNKNLGRIGKVTENNL